MNETRTYSLEAFSGDGLTRLVVSDLPDVVLARALADAARSVGYTVHLTMHWAVEGELDD